MSTRDPMTDFVVLDVETTGLDATLDRIIEVGAVRFRNGQAQAELSQLIDPQSPIPEHITRLTGISQRDCQGQPIMEQALPEILDFIGDLPLVAHNAPFDTSFLQAAFERAALPPLSNPVFDTVLLSCILLPCLKNHRLNTLAEFYGVPLERAHRALEDARATGEIFLRLLLEMADMDLAALSQLSQLASGRGSGLEEIFAYGLKSSIRGALRRKVPGAGPEILWQDFFNLTGQASQERLDQIWEEPPQRLDGSVLEALLGPDTSLGQAVGQYEHRPQQIQMVQAVARAFNSSEFLVVEAGTGTGKSLAYLIPAIHWAVENRERVIVSTHTKNLQEQLFYNDIPLLQGSLKLDFSAALVKGRSNYLCLNKWHRVLSQPDQELTAEERQQLLPLVIWASRTKTGDIVENTGFSGDGGLWSRVCAERNYCLGPRCQYHGRCFVMRIRRAAAHSHLVVVNHSLFFSDLASENAVLSDYRHVIFDEAHNLERVATQYLGCELNWWLLRNLLNRLYQREAVELGLLPTLRRRGEHAALSDDIGASLLSAIGRSIEVRNELWQLGMDFFRDLTETALDLYGREETAYAGKHRYRHADELLKVIERQAGEVEDALIRLKASLLELADLLEAVRPENIKDGEQLREELLAKCRDSQELLEALKHLISADEEQFVYWVEVPSREGSFDSRLLSAPLNIAQLMRTLVYDRLRTAIHTSATLSVAGRFDYFQDRIGLLLVEPERLRSLSLGSPFDFQEQVLICLPCYLPSPKDGRFAEAAIDAIRQAVLASRGGALVLFTAYEMLNRAYQELQEQLGQEGILVLGQGRDGSRTNILNRFREDQESVLMGTNSFWEGVDIPGKTLRSLILVKLPFLVPTEPLVEAHMERLEKQGRNSFSEYILPEAVIRFRQGFGRLIRRRDDFGVVIVLDRRVLSASYGKTFLASLPTKSWVFNSSQAMTEEIQRWLGK